MAVTMTLRIILSWTLYWAGDLWWRATEWLCHWFEWPYHVYSRLMVAAHDLQGEDTRGPWGPIERDDGETEANNGT
jgi:hypothetical protein